MKRLAVLPRQPRKPAATGVSSENTRKMCEATRKMTEKRTFQTRTVNAACAAHESGGSDGRAVAHPVTPLGMPRQQGARGGCNVEQSCQHSAVLWCAGGRCIRRARDLIRRYEPVPIVAPDIHLAQPQWAIVQAADDAARQLVRTSPVGFPARLPVFVRARRTETEPSRPADTECRDTQP